MVCKVHSRQGRKGFIRLFQDKMYWPIFCIIYRDTVRCVKVLDRKKRYDYTTELYQYKLWIRWYEERVQKSS
jgi:hypothetical protein